MKSSFWKSFILLHVALIVLIMSWEDSRANAVLPGAFEQNIPQDAIRLRILADSDSAADQVLKRRVRDEVIEAMNGWVTEPQTVEEARQTVRERLPELEERVGALVALSGFDYPVQMELGIVPFPTKVYGGTVYPAGDYEAVRITLGRGLGQNWWCVLFPPLCFVDVASGEKPAKNEGAVTIAEADVEADGADEADRPKMEFRLFLFDWVVDMANEVRSWIA